MRRQGAGCLLAAIATATVSLGCGGDGVDGEGVDGEGVGPRQALSGDEVVEATRAAQGATATIELHGSTADPPEDYGQLGYEEIQMVMDAELDFERDRLLTRMELDDVAGIGGPPIRVEQRSIDDMVYVRDGSWLCPGCGLDPEDGPPLPSDQWIPVSDPHAGEAFHLKNAMSNGLWFLTVVDDPTEPSRSDRIEGVPVTVYETDVPVDAVRDELGALPEDMAELQGEAVAVTWVTDADGRLRRSIIEYRAEDRRYRQTTTLDDFGEPVSIEVPPATEIYRGDQAG